MGVGLLKPLNNSPQGALAIEDWETVFAGIFGTVIETHLQNFIHF
jgi:hypothetical protein